MATPDTESTALELLPILTQQLNYLGEAETVPRGWFSRTQGALKALDMEKLSVSVRELISRSPIASFDPEAKPAQPATVPPNETLTEEQRKQLVDLIKSLEEKLNQPTPPATR